MENKKVFNKEKAREFNDKLIKLIKEYKDQGIDVVIKPRQQLFIDIEAYTESTDTK